MDFVVLPTGIDRLLIIDDPGGTPVTKQITRDTFFANVSSNTAFSGLFQTHANSTIGGTKASVSANVTFTGASINFNKGLTIANDSIRIANTFTPGSNNATGVKGEVAWDSTYMYVCVANNTWRRLTLEVF